MINSIPYYNSTPEQRVQINKELLDVVKALGFKNATMAMTEAMYSSNPITIDNVTVHVERESKHFTLSTEKYHRTKRDGGKSVKVPIGSLINAPRIKRQLNEIVKIQKNRVAAEIAKQNGKQAAEAYAAELNDHVKSYGATAKASWSEAIIVNVPAKALSADYLQRQGYSANVNDNAIEFTVDRHTNKVLYIECEKSMPRLQSYGNNARKELEMVIARAQEELNRLQVAEGLMDHYVQKLKIAESLEA